MVQFCKMRFLKRLSNTVLSPNKVHALKKPNPIINLRRSLKNETLSPSLGEVMHKFLERAFFVKFAMRVLT